MTKLNLSLNPDLDVNALSEAFATTGRLHIPNFLTPASAQNLKHALTENKVWYYTYSDEHGHYESPEAEVQKASQEEKAKFLNSLLMHARNNFQYFYSQYTISQAVERGEDNGHILHEVNEFVSSSPFLNFMRKLISDDEVVRADSIATKFAPGQFLLSHDDTHAQHDRRAAYVINLTTDWQPDWGGHLLFYDNDGNVVEGMIPTFNALNIFRTPQEHSVSYVPPFAGAERYAISGWLRVT